MGPEIDRPSGGRVLIDRPGGGLIAALEASSIARTVQEHDRVSNDAHRLALLLVGGFPLAPVQSAIDRDTVTLVDTAIDVLRLSTVDAHVEEVGLILKVALGVAVG